MNRLLADDSHEISNFFFLKLGKMSQNFSSAAVLIGASEVLVCTIIRNLCFSKFTVVIYS